MKQLLSLFYTFFKIGAFTFGGGYAMIPLIEREIVEKRGWIKEDDIVDIFAVSESVPGAIAINSATFIGFRIAGYSGAIFSMLGVVLPSFIIITVIAAVLSQFQELEIVKAAFSGIRAAIVALIVMAGVKVAKTAIKNWTGIVIASVAFFLLLIVNLHAIIIIILGALAGIVLFYRFR